VISRNSVARNSPFLGPTSSRLCGDIVIQSSRGIQQRFNTTKFHPNAICCSLCYGKNIVRSFSLQNRSLFSNDTLITTLCHLSADVCLRYLGTLDVLIAINEQQIVPLPVHANSYFPLYSENAPLLVSR
jgi:hypothetical protein